MKGIKAIVIRAGKYKGAGFPGTQISEEQQAIWQDTVDKTQAQFTASVASGRGLTVEHVTALADGRVWLAEDAIEKRLIDGIGSFDQFIFEMAAEIQRRNSKTRSNRMSDEQKSPQPATFAEIKAACVGADSDFICDQLEAGATKEAAVSAWMAEQQKRLIAAEEAKAEAEEAKAEAEKRTKTGKPGVDMLGHGCACASDGGDPIKTFRAAVEEKKRLGLTHTQATRAVVLEQPELHKAYIEAHNAQVRG
jgi:ClpP class serine protease